VGDPNQVSGKLLELRDDGIDTFISSGYPHLAELKTIAKLLGNPFDSFVEGGRI
jgi:alkanesulfonate monooxygenase SsuD/methylene tetrahydromethanopterin reductase-like flavin-dependent oxidoreductase (luciferase family)